MKWAWEKWGAGGKLILVFTATRALKNGVESMKSIIFSFSVSREHNVVEKFSEFKEFQSVSWFCARNPRCLIYNESQCIKIYVVFMLLLATEAHKKLSSSLLNEAFKV